jgi:cytosine deaminase
VSTADLPGAATTADTEARINLPLLVEPHAHIDKAFLAERVRNDTNDLMGAIVALDAARESITPTDTHERAVRALRMYAANGVSVVRTHADVTLANGLESLQALLAAKRDCAGIIDVQVAMLLSWPVTGPGSAEMRALADRAIAAGADVVGGCPHLDDDPAGAVEYFHSLAAASGLPLDLHADENLDPASRDLEVLADLMLAGDSKVRAVASHCVSLSMRPEHEQRAVARKVAEAGISVVCLPQTNLYLQANGIRTAPPRALAPVRVLLEEGVNVCAGGDNLQDPFNPMGRADPLEAANLLVTVAHLSPEEALECVTRSASRAIGAHYEEADSGTSPVLSVRATTVREALATGAPDRRVEEPGTSARHKRNRK